MNEHPLTPTPPKATFRDSLNRLRTSSKYQAAILLTAIGVFAMVMIILSSQPNKLDLVTKIIRWLVWIWLAAIGGTSFEDGMAKHNPGNSSNVTDILQSATTIIEHAKEVEQSPAVAQMKIMVSDLYAEIVALRQAMPKPPVITPMSGADLLRSVPASVEEGLRANQEFTGVNNGSSAQANKGNPAL